MSSPSSYKLRSSLTGHSGDVRALCTARIPSEALISGSRDKTGLIWTEESGKFVSKLCLKGHEKYVSSVCWVAPSAQNPQGLLLTGSHDKTVRVYNLGGSSPSAPVYALSGHKDAVSSIAANGDGTVLTGSWDSSAKLWQDSFCIATLEGHELAVWAVDFVQTSGGDGEVFLATGSADKTVRIWSKSGKSLKTLKGHTDVVRGLASPGGNQLLSCANDASVRLWNITTGACTMTYYGHTNYIYSIALLGSDGFVTGSEDASVRVWRTDNQDSLQTIRIPARSVWAVTTLKNGDIAAGGSDSQIRLFSRDPSRIAPPDVQKIYESELSSMELASKEVLQGIKNEDLPSEQALLSPGTKDGQTKIIRRNNAVEVYNWSAQETQWQKIGDVVGSTGGEKNSGKTLYQGKEYDFVFSVDFDESKPPIKLPYNLIDDPWLVAQQFLNENDLPQPYLETVAKFIIQNAPGAGVSAPVSNYQDPFTGGGRYVPGGAVIRNGGGGTGGADPFTGGGRYVPSGGGGGGGRPGGGGGAVNADPFTGMSSYSTGSSRGKVNIGGDAAGGGGAVYPMKEFLGFHVANVDGVLKKLQENLESAGHDLPEDVMGEFRGLMQKEISTKTPAFAVLNTLGKTLDLPESKIFPALDLLRLTIRNPTVCEYFCGPERSAFFLEFIIPLILSNKIPANQQLSVKIISNMFLGGEIGKELLFAKRVEILKALTESAAQGGDKNTQIARSTVFLNYAVLYNMRHVLEEKLQLLYTAMEIAKSPNALTDDEAVYRSLVTLGTLLVGDGSDLKGYAKALDVSVVCAPAAANSSDERVKSTWRCLEKDLQRM